MRDVYKSVFRGISDAEKHTKAVYIAVIAVFLNEEDAASRINLRAAVGLESDGGPGSLGAQRREATRSFFGNLGESEPDLHYMEYSEVGLEEE